jgi:hypothetical protein
MMENTHESVAFMFALAMFDPYVINPLVSSFKIPSVFGLFLNTGNALKTAEQLASWRIQRDFADTY